MDGSLASTVTGGSVHSTERRSDLQQALRDRAGGLDYVGNVNAMNQVKYELAEMKKLT